MNVNSSKVLGELPSKFPVIIAPDALAKIRFWVDLSPIEVSGMGKVEFKEGAYYVHEVYLLEQENSSADTEIDPAALAKCQFDTRNAKGHLNFWWHSHHSMGVFWSKTDYEAIEQIGKHGMVVATVFNKKRECRSAFYQGGDDFLPAVFVDELPTTTGIHMAPADAIQLTSEWKAKCTTKKYATVTGGRDIKATEWCETTRTWVAKGKGKPLSESRWRRENVERENNATTKKSTTQSGTSSKVTTTSLTPVTTTNANQDAYNNKRAEITEVPMRKDALAYKVDDRIDGMIHPHRGNLRWCTTRDAFIPYSLMCVDKGERYGWNVLDEKCLRTTWFEKYVTHFQEAPLYDDEIDEYYMFETDTNLLDFYLPEPSLDEIINQHQEKAVVNGNS